jgi:hypothetical protein
MFFKKKKPEFIGSDNTIIRLCDISSVSKLPVPEQPETYQVSILLRGGSGNIVLNNMSLVSANATFKALLDALGAVPPNDKTN